MAFPNSFRIFLAVVTAFFCAGVAGAQDDGPKTFEDVLKIVEASADSFKTWKADMAMSMTGQPGMTMAMNGVMMGKGEMTSSTVGTQAGGQTMTVHTVLDKDGVQWTEMTIAGRKQVMKMDSAKIKAASEDALGMDVPMGGASPMAMSQNPRDLLAAYGDMYDMTVEGAGDVEGVPVYTLNGTLKETSRERLGELQGIGLPEGDIDVSVGQEDGFIRKLVMRNAQNEPMVTMTFTNVELNAELEDGTFAYTPPEGVNVMDMTPAIEMQLKNQSQGTTTP